MYLQSAIHCLLDYTAEFSFHLLYFISALLTCPPYVPQMSVEMSLAIRHFISVYKKLYDSSVPMIGICVVIQLCLN